MTIRLRKPIRKLNALLSSVTKSAFQEHGFVEASIILEWEEIIGAHFAQYCEPLKIVFGRPQQRSHGLLHMRVLSAMAIEVAYHEKMIVDRINTYFGYPAVNRLRIAQSVLHLESRAKTEKIVEEGAVCDLDKALLKEAVSCVEGDALQNALFRLGCKVLAHDTTHKK